MTFLSTETFNVYSSHLSRASTDITKYEIGNLFLHLYMDVNAQAMFWIKMVSNLRNQQGYKGVSKRLGVSDRTLRRLVTGETKKIRFETKLTILILAIEVNN